MWKGKNDRIEDIPDSIDATLEQIHEGASVNIYTIFLFHQHLVKGPSQSFKNPNTYLRNTHGLALIHGNGITP